MFNNPRSIEALRSERYRAADRPEPVDTGWYRPKRGVILRMVWGRTPWWKTIAAGISPKKAHRGRY